MKAVFLVSLMFLPSCAEIALVSSMQNASAISRMQDRLALNSWSDANEVARRTTLVEDSNGGDPETVGVAAPTWSYGGLAVRIASPASRERLHLPELQVAAYSQSGVHPRLRIGDQEIPLAGFFREDWSRFPLSQQMLELAGRDGLIVHIECEVGNWVFRMTPAYFLGYSKKLADLRLPTLNSHKPRAP